MATIKETRPKITRAIKEAKAQGYTLLEGHTLDRNSKVCCPLGAVSLAMNADERVYGIAYTYIAASFLGMSSVQTENFINGFDFCDSGTPWIEFGASFRENN